MKFSQVAQALCGGATAVSALKLPTLKMPLLDLPGQIIQEVAATAPALPLSAFPKFTTVKLEDAIKEAAADNGQEETESTPTPVDSSPGNTTSHNGQGEPQISSTPPGAGPGSTPEGKGQEETKIAATPADASPGSSDPAEGKNGDDNAGNSPKAPITTVAASSAAAPNNTSNNDPNTTTTTNNDDDSNQADNNSTMSASSSPATAAADAACSTRPEWRSYPAADKRALVDAIACLQRRPASGRFAPATNRYEDFVRLHQTSTPRVHNNDLFLLWHRYFAWAFEQALRRECGFDRPMPWWDETRDAGRFAASPVFTREYFGSLPRARGREGTCITDGRFAGITLNIGPGGSNQPHCLSRAVDESMTAEVSKNYENTCLSRSSYPDFTRCWELGPHGLGHNSIGSVMADVQASPGDPVFWLHHLYVDRVYAAWQDADPSGARKRNVRGCADGRRPCTPLTLRTRVAMAGLTADVTVGDVLDTTNGVMCYQYSN